MGVIVRAAAMSDAEPLWEMMWALDSETSYMMYEPNERSRNLDVVRSNIRQAIEGGNLLLVAETEDQIVGYIAAQRGKLQRIKHTAYIVVGIRASHQNQGIGTRFFQQLDHWAKDHAVTRLELTVMCPNLAAKHLYEKYGFEIEGIKKRSMLVDGSYVDEYYMAKLL